MPLQVDELSRPGYRRIISLTSSKIDQLKAATFLSNALNELKIPHAYIGGFAWALLGSSRPTQISLVEAQQQLY